MDFGWVRFVVLLGFDFIMGLIWVGHMFCGWWFV